MCVLHITFRNPNRWHFIKRKAEMGDKYRSPTDSYILIVEADIWADGRNLY